MLSLNSFRPETLCIIHNQIPPEIYFTVIAQAHLIVNSLYDKLTEGRKLSPALAGGSFVLLGHDELCRINENHVENKQYFEAGGVHMIEAIVLALLVAKIRKYKLKPLLRDWSVYPVFIFAIIYIYLDFSIFHENYGLLKYSAVFKPVYIATFSILILRHRLYIAGFIGAACVTLGGVLNNIVMGTNGGKMPVFPSLTYMTGYVKPGFFERIAPYDKVHVLGNASTKLPFLADWIDLGYSVLSIGDVFIRVMAFILVYSVIKHLNTRPGAA